MSSENGRYYTSDGYSISGPFPIRELVELYEKFPDRIQYVWKKGMDDWEEADSFLPLIEEKKKKEEERKVGYKKKEKKPKRASNEDRKVSNKKIVFKLLIILSVIVGGGALLYIYLYWFF